MDARFHLQSNLRLTSLRRLDFFHRLPFVLNGDCHCVRYEEFAEVNVLRQLIIFNRRNDTAIVGNTMEIYYRASFIREFHFVDVLST